MEYKIPKLQAILILLSTIFYSASGQTKYISVFTDVDFQGKSAYVIIANCSNLLNNLTRKISSVNTRDNCVRLYDNYDCTGNYIEILRRSPAHNSLSVWKFNEKTVSVGPCPQPCYIKGSVTSVNVRLFGGKSYQAPFHDITVQGCTKVQYAFQNNTKSIQTYDNCIQLYNTEECINGPGVDTIELRPGTPAHNDLTSWYFTNVKAISRCDYKCRNTNFSIPNGEVKLFQSTDYRGNFYNLHISGSNCLDVPVRWENLTSSLGIGLNTCVILYEQRGCAGRQISINGSVSNLNSFGLGGRVRSLMRCSPKPLVTTTSRATTTTTTLPTTRTTIQMITTPTFTTLITTSRTTSFSTTTIPLTNPTPTITNRLPATIKPIIRQNMTGNHSYYQHSKSTKNKFTPILAIFLAVVPLMTLG